MSLMLGDGSQMQWVGVEPAASETAEGLKFAADSDYLAFIVLWDAGLLPTSTYIWLAAHCIEKYLKAVLMKRGRTCGEMRKYRHRIADLWSEARPQLGADNQQPHFDGFVAELQAVEPAVRYGSSGIVLSSGLLAIVAVLGAALRYEFLGKDRYAATPFGLGDHFLPRIGSAIALPVARVHRILHVLMHHNITLSSMFIPDTFSFMGMAASTGHLSAGPDCVCPWCNGYRGIGQAATLNLRRYVENV